MFNLKRWLFIASALSSISLPPSSPSSSSSSSLFVNAAPAPAPAPAPAADPAAAVDADFWKPSTKDKIAERKRLAEGVAINGLTRPDLDANGKLAVKSGDGTTVVRGKVPAKTQGPRKAAQVLGEVKPQIRQGAVEKAAATSASVQRQGKTAAVPTAAAVGKREEKKEEKKEESVRPKMAIAGIELPQEVAEFKKTNAPVSATRVQKMANPKVTAAAVKRDEGKVEGKKEEEKKEKEEEKRASVPRIDEADKTEAKVEKKIDEGKKESKEEGKKDESKEGKKDESKEQTSAEDPPTASDDHHDEAKVEITTKSDLKPSKDSDSASKSDKDSPKALIDELKLAKEDVSASDPPSTSPAAWKEGTGPWIKKINSLVQANASSLSSSAPQATTSSTPSQRPYIVNGVPKGGSSSAVPAPAKTPAPQKKAPAPLSPAKKLRESTLKGLAEPANEDKDAAEKKKAREGKKEAKEKEEMDEQDLVDQDLKNVRPNLKAIAPPAAAPAKKQGGEKPKNGKTERAVAVAKPRKTQAPVLKAEFVKEESNEEEQDEEEEIVKKGKSGKSEDKEEEKAGSKKGKSSSKDEEKEEKAVTVSEQDYEEEIKVSVDAKEEIKGKKKKMLKKGDAGSDSESEKPAKVGVADKAKKMKKVLDEVVEAEEHKPQEKKKIEEKGKTEEKGKGEDKSTKKTVDEKKIVEEVTEDSAHKDDKVKTVKGPTGSTIIAIPSAHVETTSTKKRRRRKRPTSTHNADFETIPTGGVAAPLIAAEVSKISSKALPKKISDIKADLASPVKSTDATKELIDSDSESDSSHKKNRKKKNKDKDLTVGEHAQAKAQSIATEQDDDADYDEIHLVEEVYPHTTIVKTSTFLPGKKAAAATPEATPEATKASAGNKPKVRVQMKHEHNAADGSGTTMEALTSLGVPSQTAKPAVAGKKAHGKKVKFQEKAEVIEPNVKAQVGKSEMVKEKIEAHTEKIEAHAEKTEAHAAEKTPAPVAQVSSVHGHVVQSSAYQAPVQSHASHEPAAVAVIATSASAIPQAIVIPTPHAVENAHGAAIEKPSSPVAKLLSYLPSFGLSNEPSTAPVHRQESSNYYQAPASMYYTQAVADIIESAPGQYAPVSIASRTTPAEAPATFTTPAVQLASTPLFHFTPTPTSHYYAASATTPSEARYTATAPPFPHHIRPALHTDASKVIHTVYPTFISTTTSSIWATYKDDEWHTDNWKAPKAVPFFRGDERPIPPKSAPPPWGTQEREAERKKGENWHVRDGPVSVAKTVVLPGYEHHKQCGFSWYNPLLYNCYREDILCPIINSEPTLLCNDACYLPSQYDCVGGKLLEKDTHTPARQDPVHPNEPVIERQQEDGWVWDGTKWAQSLAHGGMQVGNMDWVDEVRERFGRNPAGYADNI